MDADDDRKASNEQFHFDAFRRLLPEFPKGDVTRGVPPAPDFLVTMPSGLLGIEHTALSTERRAAEELRRQAVALGKAEYVSRGAPEAIASFFWSEVPLKGRAKVRELGLRLADLVAKHLPAAEPGLTVLEWPALREAGLDELLDMVRIARIAGARTAWGSPDSGHLDAQSELAQHRIAAKEANLPAYRRTCSEVWLLMVAEGFSISRMVDCDALAGMELTSTFDRVFLLDLFRSRLYPLRVRQP